VPTWNNRLPETLGPCCHDDVCGRLSLTSSGHREAAQLIAGLVPRFEPATLATWLARADYRPSYNVGPGRDHWVVRARAGRPILVRAHWGLVRPAPRGLIINARAETLRERPMFRSAFDEGRCLVVADGFFEWDRRGAHPQPWWFRDAAHRGLLFAAVMTEAHEAEARDAFAIVTVPANEQIAAFHGRMPAIIDTAVHEQWLFGPPPDAAQLLVSSAPDTLQAIPVSRRLNSIEHDDPACIERVDLGRSSGGQLSLLGEP
jgi:putative SOS response-associated peptidase YedK